VREGADALKRALACALIMLLPENGLEEAFSWLKDAWQFYSREMNAIPQPLILHTGILGALEQPIARAALTIDEE
jgi:hypothetical protein